MTWPLIPNPRFLLHSLVRDKKLFTLTIIYTVNEFKKMASSKNRKVEKQLSYLTIFPPELSVRRGVPVVSFLTRELMLHETIRNDDF